jgi:transcriptional regulator with XRE-family HTH domain
MGIAVYSRLGDVLRNQDLTVSDLQRRIAARFGLAMDMRTLDRLARADRVRRPNLEIVAAAAGILGVGFDDIFVVRTSSEEEDVLDPDQSHCLEDLLEAQDWRTLTGDEHAELRALVAEWGHRANEQVLRDIAAKRGQPIEQVRADVAADLDRALVWWEEVQADPAHLEALVAEARESQRVRAVG